VIGHLKEDNSQAEEIHFLEKTKWHYQRISTVSWNKVFLSAKQTTLEQFDGLF
jgi:hypothetical protein